MLGVGSFVQVVRLSLSSEITAMSASQVAVLTYCV
jgi:hypothetical protein